jgi:hypothetical protein
VNFSFAITAAKPAGTTVVLAVGRLSTRVLHQAMIWPFCHSRPLTWIELASSVRTCLNQLR